MLINTAIITAILIRLKYRQHILCGWTVIIHGMNILAFPIIPSDDDVDFHYLTLSVTDQMIIQHALATAAQAMAPLMYDVINDRSRTMKRAERMRRAAVMGDTPCTALGCRFATVGLYQMSCVILYRRYEKHCFSD